MVERGDRPVDDVDAGIRAMTRTRRAVASFAAALLVVASAACSGPSRADPNSPSPSTTERLRAVSLPPLAGMTESVADQLTERQAAVEAERERTSRDDRALAEAYGELGKVLLGARYLDAAEPALRNAATLAPSDQRWPYYLAHLERERGNLAEAATQFERSLELRGADLPTLVWLADAYLTGARLDAAEPLVQRALAADPRSVAALYQAGRLALARNDYRTAVERFESALALDATAAAVHYPLAMAYRGLGDTARAERHLAQRARDNRIVPPADPLMRLVEDSVTGPQALEVRGVEALNRGEWAAAAETFRQATAMAPRSAPLHHRLGTALAMMGRPGEARREFERAIAVSPRYAKAHYSLGLLAEDGGDDDTARVEYAAAVAGAPDYAAARLRLADVLRRGGRLQDALSEYERVAEADPSLSDAVLGRALTLADLGRYGEARDQLSAGMMTFPEHMGFPHALARVLAAAPDDRVRDGRRALALIEGVLQRDKSTNTGEALAMALAELQRFDEAAAVQRDLIAAARQAGDPQLARALGDNLGRYQARRPSRIMWRTDEAGRAR